MHDFVTQEIRRLYSTYNGWNITSRSQKTEYDEVISLQRFESGHREIVKVGVTFAKEINPDLINTVTIPERSPDGTVARFSAALVLPLNADTSAAPGNVAVHHMHSFAYDGDSLIWLKKPVCASAGAAAPSAK
ncbi:MAG TPA: hypothetical protein PLO06_07550 [Methanoregulaceae archaeon]|nr:hypothetical protein [Methanoregulaceae archaeon]HPD75654.1 hypothetical protein [Methanoregulaceae archaeon]